jgi:HD-like signal output (HDOD) protein
VGDTLTRLLSTGLIRLIKEGRVEVPVIAPMARDIQRLLAQPECGSQEIMEVVGQDPAVVRAVLKTASSSYFQGASRAFGLEEACNRLGNRRVLGIAQQVIVGDLFEFEEGEMKEIVLETWRNLIVTSHGARVLASDVGHPDPEAVYIAALFHNIGEIVLLRIIGGRLDGSALGEGVRDRVGGQLMLQHESVGKMVIEQWGMPPDLVRLAGTHHLAPRAAPSERSRVTSAQLCMAAWTVAIDCGYTYIGAAGNVDPTPWVELLGLELVEAKRLFSDAAKWVEQAANG